MAGFPNLSDLKYGGFYIPVFSLAYIQDEFILPVNLPFPIFDIIISTGNLGHFLALAVFGGLIEHGINRAIFGPGGAVQNPKNAWIVRWHKLLFLAKPAPGLFPESPEDLIEKIDTSTEAFLDLKPAQKAVFALSRGIRLLVIGGAVVLFTMLVYSLTVFFLLQALRGTLGYLGLVLALSQLIFFFGSTVLGQFASVVKPDAARWLFVPEYQKSRILKNREEIEFEYDPRGFFETDSWISDKRNEAEKLDCEDDYLIPLSDDDDAHS